MSVYRAVPTLAPFHRFFSTRLRFSAIGTSVFDDALGAGLLGNERVLLFCGDDRLTGLFLDFSFFLRARPLL